MTENLKDLLLEKFTAYNRILSLDASKPVFYQASKVIEILESYMRITHSDSETVRALDPSPVTKEGKYFTRLCKALPKIEDATTTKPVNVTEKVKSLFNALVNETRASGEPRLDLDKIAKIFSSLEIDQYPIYRYSTEATVNEIQYIIRQWGNDNYLDLDAEDPYRNFIDCVFHRSYYEFYAGSKTEKAKAEIGERIKREAKDGGECHWLLSISDTIFWEDGNFGKDSSCWWGSYEESQPVFLENGGIGLLWHNDPDDPKNGIARCWIATLKGGKVLFLFNQYGKIDGKTIRIEDTVNQIARLLGEDYTVNDGTLSNEVNSDIPYINGNSGYYIAHKDYSPRNGGDFTVQWGEDDRELCENCNEYFNEDDTVYIDGCTYCQDCANELFTTCEHCGERVSNDDAYTANDDSYCEYCFNRYFTTCEHCNDAVRHSDSQEGPDGNQYCESCFYNLFTECSNCSETIANEDAHRSEQNDSYCETCYNNLFVVCEDCGLELDRNDSPDGIHCEDCHNEQLKDSGVAICGRCYHHHALETTRLDGLTTLCPACASLTADAGGIAWEVQALNNPLS